MVHHSTSTIVMKTILTEWMAVRLCHCNICCCCLLLLRSTFVIPMFHGRRSNDAVPTAILDHFTPHEHWLIGRRRRRRRRSRCHAQRIAHFTSMGGIFVPECALVTIPTLDSHDDDKRGVVSIARCNLFDHTHTHSPISLSCVAVFRPPSELDRRPPTEVFDFYLVQLWVRFGTVLHTAFPPRRVGDFY